VKTRFQAFAFSNSCNLCCYVLEHFGTRVTNVVFMGMGEPLLNIPNVLRAHEALNAEVGPLYKLNPIDP
jgi:adenine C2-methylase RlmN of 23S rRNA A2503 and tRNA A37